MNGHPRQRQQDVELAVGLRENAFQRVLQAGGAFVDGSGGDVEIFAGDAGSSTGLGGSITITAVACAAPSP